MAEVVGPSHRGKQASSIENFWAPGTKETNSGDFFLSFFLVFSTSLFH